jgi:hypothetical protein
VSGSACPTVAGATTTCTGKGVCGYTCNMGYKDCDGQPGNGCEVDTTSNALNCASCGHTCGGGACSASTCQAMVVQSGLGYITGLAVDSTSVYWSDVVGVEKSASSGGAVTTLIPVSYDGELTLDGTYLFAKGGTSVYQVPIGGGTIITVPGVGTGNSPLADGSKVYWAVSSIIYGMNYGQQVTKYAYYPGGGAGSVGDSMVLAGGYIYFKESSASGWDLKRMTTSNHVTSTVTSGGSLPPNYNVPMTASSLAVDDAQAYWVEWIGSMATSGISTTPITGSGNVLYVNLTAAGVGTFTTDSQMLVDATNVYVSDPVNAGNGIIEVNKATKAVRKLSTDKAVYIAQDANYIYWAVSLAAPNGAIKRIVKN